jgi:hypothetical protein
MTLNAFSDVARVLLGIVGKHPLKLILANNLVTPVMPMFFSNTHNCLSALD